MRLTKANVAKLSLPEGKSELLVFDEALAGFGIRLRYGGKRTWIALYTERSAQSSTAVCRSGQVKLSTHRRPHQQAKNGAVEGQLAARILRSKKSNGRLKASVTIGATVESCQARRRSHLKPNSLADVRRYLRAHFGLPSPKSPSILSRGQWFAAANGLYASDRARAALSTFYSWAIGEGLANENPVVR